MCSPSYICMRLISFSPLNLRNNSRMPGSMLILTWVGIIFVIILHRAKARCKILTNIMPTHVASENYFDSSRAFMVILCIQAYLDRGYFWSLFQLPPAIIYKNR